MNSQNFSVFRLSVFALVILNVVILTSLFITRAQQNDSLQKGNGIKFDVVIQKEYFLEENILIGIALTNESGAKQRIKDIQSRKFRVKVEGPFDEKSSSIKEFTFDGSADLVKAVPIGENGTVLMVEKNKERYTDVIEGEKSSFEIDLSKSLASSMGVGSYEIVINFENGQEIVKDFKVVFDEEKSTPILASKLKSQSDADQNWAFSNLLKFNKVKLILLLEEMQTSEDSSQRTRASSLLNQLKVNKLY